MKTVSIDPIYEYEYNRYYAQAGIPADLDYCNENSFVEQFFSKKRRFGFEYTLSDYFTYSQTHVVLPENTPQGIHNKNWKHVDNKFLLPRHRITMKDSTLDLTSQEIDQVIVCLINFLRESGRTIRELIVDIPNDESIQYNSYFDHYRIYFKKPEFLMYCICESKPHFYIEKFSAKAWNSIAKYNANINQACDVDKMPSTTLFLPFYWLQGVVLNR